MPMLKPANGLAGRDTWPTGPALDPQSLNRPMCSTTRIQRNTYPKESDMNRSKSLRWWGIIVTVIGGAIALATFLFIEWTNRYNYSGVMLYPAFLLTASGLVAVGGIITLIVDGILRLTGRRF